jgi:serine/threonine protein phosphatase PrpC
MNPGSSAVAWLTDRGMRRRSNEDAVRADPEREVYVVADGLGGLPGGEVASRIAAESLVVALASLPRDESLPAEIRDAIAGAHAAVRKAGTAEPRLTGMGTTVVLAVGAAGDWVIAHVGDSRAYLLGDGRFRRLTTDHNVAAELVARSQIGEAEARHHPGRNVVTRTLGAGSRFEPEISRFPRRNGDRLLLCTDGLTTVLDDDGIGRVLVRCGSPDACCRELVDLANDGGGPDNITVLVADCPAPPGPTRPPTG